VPGLNNRVDVAIIGAGPAGSAAAIELARAGRQVLLIERKQFPRDKVCGGCLSGQAVAALRRLIGAEQDLPGIVAERVTFAIGSYRLTCRPRGLTRIALRCELDSFLANTAAAAGAEVCYGEPAALVPSETGWEVLIGDHRVRARWILLAAGLSGLPHKIGIAGRPQQRRMLAQQWTQPTQPALPAVGHVELQWLRGGYVGLATPTRELTVVALAAESPEFPQETAWQRLRRLNPTAPIWNALPADAPGRYGAKGSAGFPWVSVRLGSANVLLIGDAAGYEEPFSGEGMGQALCSAACAAQAVLRGADVLADYTVLMGRYHCPSAARVRRLSRFLHSAWVHRLAEGPMLLPPGLLAHAVDWVHVRAHA